MIFNVSLHEDRDGITVGFEVKEIFPDLRSADQFRDEMRVAAAKLAIDLRSARTPTLVAG